MSQGDNEEPIPNSEEVIWKLVYTKQAQKDAKKLASSNLKEKAEELLAVLKQNPFQNPPPYEKLVGDLSGAYSRRINIQHRLVYEVIESEQVVKIIRMWTHYE
ncbi:Txe/YoeB family addiction module toxin [Nostoc sp. UHCC 0302]|uniref:Txe/YoeB family addiction module toxin n=1 Tax=Nostoc sp. UHCC 0302 TaxID=3134896 RepID=UPI00311CC1DA